MKKERTAAWSRRDFMTAAGIFAAGGIAGCTSRAVSPPPSAPEAPPLPWQWTKLDPLEAGRRAYRGYLTKPPGG
jgi:hypothetical protein